MNDQNEGLSTELSDGKGMTHVIAQGGFQTVEGHRKRLASKGVTAAVICPPGVDTNG
ncbi:hypothetical protein Poly30_21460 [Planctomycetes bacterium Poly30]|uniref:Uncharacterized protein n=1 Tax=Saltatorellus ferox TaxID=2528018 RepID=A0A518ERB5_9BACT|nr:hypothetical protein Poly30_21460 [Planctomycetes bacterium Poly30]